MGGEHTPRRKHVYLYLAYGMMVVLWIAGCSHLSENNIENQRLMHVRKDIEKGDFKAALDSSRALRISSPRSMGDKTLYLMGLIHSHPDNPDRDLSKALASFRTILFEYRNSPLAVEADIWMGLIEEYLYSKGQIAKLFKKYAALEATLAQKKTQTEKLYGEIQDLHNQNELLQRKLVRLKSQMERFKQVDLGIDAKKRQAVPEVVFDKDEAGNE